jgi:hypothetical protein
MRRAALRILYLLSFLYFLPAPTFSQTPTVVTGTVTDPNGVPYSFAKISAQLIPTTTSPTVLVNGNPTQIGGQSNANADANGTFSMNLFCNTAGGGCSVISPSGTQWQITVNINGVPPPVGTGPQACSATVTISGGSQTVTSSFNACPALLNGGRAILFSGAPTGSCLDPQNAKNNATGDFYSCVGGAWLKIGPGGNPGVLVSPVITPNPLNLDVNLGFKGPNPWIDATRLGVRAVAGDGFSTTVSCTSGSANVTIGAISSFQNGDGVVLYGCGSGTVGVPSAPTVVRSLAAAQTGMLLDVTGPVGATTYCYQLLARTLLGATNVSTETCIANGPASLGLQTNTITTATLSNTTATYTTSAAHGLVAGAHIVVTGMATNVSGGQTNGTAVNIPFNCWCKVATVPDNTHFTVNLMSDSRNGAVTAGTGGTVSYWNSIHITATETTNNYQYYLYGRVSGGTKVLIGAMWPQDVNLVGRLSDVTYLVADDFGSTVTTFPNPPSYIPTTVPTTATNEMLPAIIVSGAGTTSLVLDRNAGNSISGQTIVFDDAVTFLAAATVAGNAAGGTQGQLMLPEIGSTANSINYVFNSPITLGTGATSRLAVLQKGPVRFNEPMSTTVIDWRGQTSTNSVVASFANLMAPAMQFNKCSPCIIARSSTLFSNLVWSMLSLNGALGFIQESGGIPSSGAFRDVIFSTGTSTNYSNMAAVFRGDGAGYDFTNTALTGPQNGNLTGTTPGMYFDWIGNATFKNLSLSGIGIATRVNPAGGFLVVDAPYSQGGYQPYFSVAADSTDPTASFAIALKNVSVDTTSIPIVANYGGHGVTVDVVNTNTLSANDAFVTGSSVSGNFPRMFLQLSGSGGVGTPINIGASVLNSGYAANDGIFGRVATMPIEVINKSVSIGPAFSLFTTTGFYPAPTCPTSGAGSVPAGLTYYAYAPIFANGSEGTLSFLCNVTPNGSQGVQLNWTAVAGVTQYNVYRGASLSNLGGLNCSPFTGPSYLDTLASTCGFGSPTLAAGGPAGMRGGLIWGQTAQIGDRATVTSAAGAPAVGLCTTSTGGKIYLRTDGTTTTTLYVCDGATGTWTAK